MDQGPDQWKARLQAGFRLGDWHVQPTGNRLQRNGKIHQVGSKAMDLLVVLASRSPETVSKDEIFTGTKLEIGYVRNQGRHIREWSPFNVAMPEGYVASLLGGGTVTLTSDEITAGPRSWIPGDTDDQSWSGQRARRPYPQLAPASISRPHGNMHYNSLQAKLERRFQDGLALNYNGNWGGSREYDRGTLKGVMLHDRTHTFYNATVWQLPFFENSRGFARSLLGGVGGHRDRDPDFRVSLPNLVRPGSLESGTRKPSLSGPARQC